jgi:hypothetical protein
MADMKSFAILTMSLLLLVAGCGKGQGIALVDQKGVVKYVDVEGGFFAIIGDDGRNFKPVNLAAGFKHEGRRVAFTGRRRDDLFMFHQWGTPLEILEISAEEGSK